MVCSFRVHIAAKVSAPYCLDDTKLLSQSEARIASPEVNRLCNDGPIRWEILRFVHDEECKHILLMNYKSAQKEQNAK